MLRSVLAMLIMAFGRRPFTMLAVIEMAAAGGTLFPEEHKEIHGNFREAVNEIASGNSGKISGRRLAWWFRKNTGKIADGLRLVQAEPDLHAKVARWQIETL